MQQITDTILMVRPASFGYNEETAKDNQFQSSEGKENIEQIKAAALEEFDDMVAILKNKGIEVIVKNDTVEPKKYDAIFPNNWFSTHENGIWISYPMCAEVRRLEKREDLFEFFENELGYKKRYSFDYFEEDDMFLEGTGSMILDRQNRLVYACRSKRTDVRILSKFGILMDYQAIHFESFDNGDNEVYHTNVMMALGEKLAIICLASIHNEEERKKVVKSLTDTDKVIVDITKDQMHQFAGNMLELRSKDLTRFLVMSGTARAALTEEQVEAIEKYDEIIAIDIPTIEKYGGGSVRCMMAEIFKIKK